MLRTMKKNSPNTRNGARALKTPDVPAPEKPKKNTFFSRIWPYAAMAVLAIVVFAGSLKFPADKLDEEAIITKNLPFLTQASNIGSALTTDAFFNNPPSRFYRPLQNLSFLADAVLFDGSTQGFHFTSLLLHVLTCFSIFYLLTLLGFNRTISLFSTLVFTAHPLFVQAVVWLPSRGDLLLGLFGILSLIFFIKYFRTRKVSFFVLHALTFLLAVMSKESAVLLPLIYFAFYYWFEREKNTWLSLLKFAIIYMGAGLLYFLARHFFLIGSVEDSFGIRVFFHNIRALPELFGKFFFPVSLSPMTMFSMLSTFLGLGIMAVIISMLFVLKNNKYKSIALFGLIFFLVLTLPGMAYSHGKADIGYDYLVHRAYLPSFGLLLVTVCLLAYFTKHLNKWLIPLCSVLVLTFAQQSFRYVDVFKNAETFYTRVIELNPGSIMAYNNLGTWAATNGNKTLSMEMFSRAIRRCPNNEKAFYNRGRLRMQLKDYKGAIEDLNVTLILKPDHFGAYNNRGMSKGLMQDFTGAIGDFSQAIRLNPEYSKAYFNRGNAEMAIDSLQSACSDWEKAASLGENAAQRLLKEYCR